MAWRYTLAKVLAIVGSLLVAAPIVAMFATARWASSGFMIDWLMPTELGFVAIAGAALLLAATFISRMRRILIGSLAAAAAIVVSGGLLVASLSGLASGAAQPESSAWTEVVVWAVWVYDVLLVLLAGAGAYLAAELFRQHRDDNGATSGRAIPAA